MANGYLDNRQQAILLLSSTRDDEGKLLMPINNENLEKTMEESDLLINTDVSSLDDVAAYNILPTCLKMKIRPNVIVKQGPSKISEVPVPAGMSSMETQPDEFESVTKNGSSSEEGGDNMVGHYPSGAPDNNVSENILDYMDRTSEIERASDTGQIIAPVGGREAIRWRKQNHEQKRKRRSKR